MSKLKNNKNIKKNNEIIINVDKKSTNVNDKEKVFVVNNSAKNKQYTDDELFDINYDFFNNNNHNDFNIEKKNAKKNFKFNLKLNIDTNSYPNQSSNSLSRNRSTSLSINNRSSSLSSQNNNDIYKKIEDKNSFFNELLKKQIVGITSDKKLNYNDVKRISKFIKTSIFDKKKCSLWNGYITNENNNSKGTYINFYFNKKKIALHRLLYMNYIGDLSDNEYLKFTCENKGKCCNIHHMKKFVYSNKNESCKLKNNCGENIGNKSKNNDLFEPVQINIDKKKLIVEI